MPAPAGLDAGTASQLIRGVGRTMGGDGPLRRGPVSQRAWVIVRTAAYVATWSMLYWILWRISALAYDPTEYPAGRLSFGIVVAGCFVIGALNRVCGRTRTEIWSVTLAGGLALLTYIDRFYVLDYVGGPPGVWTTLRDTGLRNGFYAGVLGLVPVAGWQMMQAGLRRWQSRERPEPGGRPTRG